jgi:hypothetical protein
VDHEEPTYARSRGLRKRTVDAAAGADSKKAPVEAPSKR